MSLLLFFSRVAEAVTAIPIAIGVPAATLIGGPQPVAVAVAIPAHTLYQGAETTPIAVAVNEATLRQISTATATAIAVGVPTQTLVAKPAVTVIIGGVAVPRVRVSAISLTEALNHEADSAAFRVDGFVPLAGQPVSIELRGELKFAGTVMRVTQVHEGRRRDQIAYDVDCRDHGWLLDRRLVNAQYTATAADVIAKDVLTRFTTGFTTANIATGLPVIDEMQITDEYPSGALTRIFQRIGGYWYADPTRDVHGFLTETDVEPDPITDADPATAAPEIHPITDIAQIRTRIIVEGGGSNSVTEAPAGATVLPVEDPVWYSASGGAVKVATQRLTYTGRLIGGAGSTLRSLDAPTATPTAALTSGVGGVLGAVTYKVSFKNDAGETAVGPASNSVTGVAVSPPGSAPSLSAASGVGRLVGTFGYAVTFVTARGETTLGSGASITVSAFSTPSTPSAALATEIVGGNSTATMGKVIGTVLYKVGFVTAEGETLPSSPSASVNAPAYVPSPQQPGTSITGGVTDLQGDASGIARYLYKATFVNVDGETLGSAAVGAVVAFTATSPSIGSAIAAGGNLTASATYNYKVTYITARGRESLASGATAQTTGTVNKSVTVSFSSGSGIAGVVGKRVYRTRANGATYYLLTEIRDTSTTAIIDGAPDDNLQIAMPAVGTAANAVTVTAPQGPTGTVARRLYRTKYNDTSAYYFIGELSGSSGGSIIDIRDDLDLGDGMPLSTLVGGKVTVTIPTGPTGTLARRLYRSTAGGEYKQVVELQNNTATSYVDTTADPTGPSPPLVATAGGANVTVGVATGPTGTIARRIYRTKAGGGPLYFVAQLSDNSTGSYTDSKLDTELGEESPPLNSAGASAVSVTLPVGPAGITARRLYRIDSAGVYRFVTEVPNNTATSVIDALTETELGEVALAVGTIGALPGATEVLVDAAGTYDPGGGWIYIGNQLVRFGARSLSPAKLTGIPATGAGAIVTALRVGEDVIAASMLTGIPASGTGSIAYTIKAGEPVNILVERDDGAAQAALAAREGGDGVHEFKITDNRLSIQGATDRADAELALFALPIVTVTYQTRDPKTRAGRTVTINLGAPKNLVGTFKIQRVTRTELGLGAAAPLCTVEASSVKFSLEDVLRRVVLRAA